MNEYDVNFSLPGEFTTYHWIHWRKIDIGVIGTGE